MTLLSLWLLLVWMIQKIIWKKQGLVSFLLTGVFTASLLLLPISGLSIAHWIMSFVSSWSAPLTGLLFIAILEYTFSWKFFSTADWKAAWFFGAGAALLLYPSALGLGKIDTYVWGWGSPWLLGGIGLIALFLIFLKNRFAILLMLAFAAFLLRLQPSTNFWDYLIDPFYGAVAIVEVVKLVIKPVKKFDK
ncbi:MAG: hypothetical protein K2W99_05040 [Chthoniobacterales bacterium]|nr:hypothetical protein [Chthoniobacterales bacterium]